jgi:glutathione peroxidase
MSIYDIETTTLEGEPTSLSRYAGQVTLFVNVASECGYTRQYAGLQKLHDRYRERGFAVLGFPSNEFGKQEPGSASEIRAFCETRFGVDFPLFEKCETKSGPGQSPLFAELGREAGALPSWNFGKYLVGRDGAVLEYFASAVEPDDSKLIIAIESALERDPKGR